MTGLAIFLAFLVVCVHGIGVYVVLGIRRELAGIRAVLERTLNPSGADAAPTPTDRPALTGGTTRIIRTPSVYAIWIFKGRCWELDLTSVPAGYAAGSPPTFAGAFEGQRVKTECKRC